MWQSISYYAALVLESALGVFGIRIYEEPRYEVIDHLSDRVEIRRYGPRVAVEVQLASADEAERSRAFQLLFRYIAGANRMQASGGNTMAMTTPVEVRDRELVAMTVPVETVDSRDTGHMRFFLPSKYGLDSAPKPENPAVRLAKVPEETIATLRFSGSPTYVAKRKAELVKKLAGTNWQPTSAPYTLFYDAPFTLPFLRRNEAAVAVARRA